jgi:uncharacterized protein
MLVEFTVGNYRSFKEPVTLSMVAAKIKSKDKRLDEENVFVAPDGERLLKSAALYGANASGKSNLVRAVIFMQQFVLGSYQGTMGLETNIFFEPFRLDSQTQRKPSLFEVVFFLEGHKYRYGFEVEKQLVVSEWLFWVPSSREARLFVREGDQYKISGQFDRGSGSLQARTRKDALFLSVVAQFNGQLATKIREWILEIEVFAGLFNVPPRSMAYGYLKEELYKQEVAAFIKQLDLGIADIVVEEIPLSDIDVLSQIPEGIRPLAGITSDGKYMRIAILHRLNDAEGRKDTTIKFDLELNESHGTQKIFAIAGLLMDVLRKGGLLIVDELDVRLHPLITSTIVRMFNSPETNPKNAQLIFTTHDTNLLDADLLRRDQIWFLEKDDFEASHLHSLVEYKVRNDASFEKDYMRGKYGAIPFIGGVKRITSDSDE